MNHIRFSAALLFLAGLSAVAWAGGMVAGPELVDIPAGPFVMGSDAAEREAAYRLDEAGYGHDATRGQRWYAGEGARRREVTGAFAIMRAPVTNEVYSAFLRATGHPPPAVDATAWRRWNLAHPFSRTRRHAWDGPMPPKGRAAHPVVLVSHDDARAYAAWLSSITGRIWRLPSEAEWEKAVRGTDGRRFPWGDDFDPVRLNSADAGPFDTLPVGRFSAGEGPFGLLDGAGQVFEWTSTATGPGRYIVKGGSWDDKGCGVCRPAARHSRDRDLKHILIGFRLVAEVEK